MSITLNPYLMLLVFVTFMLLIFLLNQWLFKPMLAFMSNRDSFIDQEITNTQGYRGEIDEIEKEIARTLSLARKEAAQILESATKEAKTNYEEKINAKKVENESKLAQAKQELEEQKSQLYAELLEQLPVFKNALNAKLEQI
ncbi:MULTISPECIES: FoF1 ATP synthase subunit B' [Helicobacter]|uniref:ATP synthase subunit b n=3 Tax=Helicobacter typhlonius TaxID=76936 RepID=A0A099UGQ5_9HELI|nr:MULTISPECIES: FoF1 ATP synthase subunit B' [Helicobacter]TLD79471.1 F0F1 ATP synthase subunit B' [Helicobacter typhlonius]TLD86638.1 F0F1 ATP synthase subunit B' [Helicobacter sp. MIT 03-1616]CUU39418.1 ATP synthase F0 sector subunit b' [Helicobacter typhlonius]